GGRFAWGRLGFCWAGAGLRHPPPRLPPPGGHRREDIPIKVDNAPLPSGFRQALAQRLHEAQALVGGHQPHALQPPRLQVAEEGQPAGRVLLAAFHHPQHLAVAIGVHPDGHQDRHVADLAAPGPFQPDAVEEDVGVPALDGAVPPLLDAGVDRLVQLADRARADLRTPQGLRDVLDTADGDAGQVHLDEGLLHGGLAAAVALDDLRLEGQLAQAGYLQLDLASLGVQGAGVAAGAGVQAVGGALVAPGVAEAV